MADLIDRQEALEGLYDVFFDDELSAAYPEEADKVLDVIRKLPSAQPELIAKVAYIRGFEQGRTQGMIDAQERKK